MPDDPTTDPSTAPAPDPGRPDPPPAVGGAAPWSAASDAAALNPLAPGVPSSGDAEAPAEPWSAEPSPAEPWPDAAPADDAAGGWLDMPAAVGPASIDAAPGDVGASYPPTTAIDGDLEPYAPAPYDPGALAGAPRDAFDAPADDRSAGALPAWPAPAPAPGGYESYRPMAAEFGEEALPAPSAAAPSRPSVPWDPHQDGLPPAASASTPGGRLAAKAGSRALYWVGGAVIVFLAFTALLFNVFVRSDRMAARVHERVVVAPTTDRSSAPADDRAPAVEKSVDAAAGDGANGAAKASFVQTGTLRAPAPGAAASTLAAPAADPSPGAITRAPAGRAAAPPSAPDAGPPGASPLDGSIVVPNGYRRYDDARHGFSLRVPSDWREAHRSADPADGAASPDDDVVFESASGEQRLAVSVWGAADRPPFDGWLPIAAVGMQPLDDGAVHADDAVPYNAFLGGEPAVVLGAAETPVSHLAYAAFLQHGERYVRVAWADMTGLTRPDDVLGALASFGWVGDDLITGSDKGPNQVPRLSLPQGVYWPSEALFGR